MVAGGGLEGGQRPEHVKRFKGLVEENTVVEGSFVVGGLSSLA